MFLVIVDEDVVVLESSTQHSVGLINDDPDQTGTYCKSGKSNSSLDLTCQ